MCNEAASSTDEISRVSYNCNISYMCLIYHVIVPKVWNVAVKSGDTMDRTGELDPVTREKLRRRVEEAAAYKNTDSKSLAF